MSFQSIQSPSVPPSVSPASASLPATPPDRASRHGHGDDLDTRGTLLRYGWAPADEAAFAARRVASESPARVLRRDRDRCLLITEHGPSSAPIGLRVPIGPDVSPCTGDWVAVGLAGREPPMPGPAGTGDEPVIVAVLPRRSALIRSSASQRSTGQVLAANIDLVLIVATLTEPPRPGRMERLLALAWESGATPLVVLTKADLASAKAAHSSWLAAMETLAPGVAALAVSAHDGRGLDMLRGELAGPAPAGRSAVLVGPSGVGKSTLVNALAGSDHLAVGPVRRGDGKGRHTTVSRELVPLPAGGVLIDTPGLRGVGLWGSGEGVDTAFTEIVDLAGSCRYADCEHRTEPGCAVLAAVEDGALPERRLASYRKLQRESAWVRSREDARLAADERARHKRVHREQRRLYADRKRQGRDR